MPGPGRAAPADRQREASPSKQRNKPKRAAATETRVAELQEQKRADLLDWCAPRPRRAPRGRFLFRPWCEPVAAARSSLVCVDNCAHQTTTAGGVVATAGALGLADRLQFVEGDAFEIFGREDFGTIDLFWLDFGVGDRVADFAAPRRGRSRARRSMAVSGTGPLAEHRARRLRRLPLDADERRDEDVARRGARRRARGGDGHPGGRGAPRVAAGAAQALPERAFHTAEAAAGLRGAAL